MVSKSIKTKWTTTLQDPRGITATYSNRLTELQTDKSITKYNRKLIKAFIDHCYLKGLKTGTLLSYMNFMQRLGKNTDAKLDKLNEIELFTLMTDLESKGYSTTTINSQKKILKTLYNWKYDGTLPKHIRLLKSKKITNTIDPEDLLTEKEAMQMLDACLTARDRGMIALFLDSALRASAVASLTIRSIKLNNNSAIVYPNPAGTSNKTFKEPIAITWSAGYIAQWLSVHPDKNNPNAPLWVNLSHPYGKSMSYSGMIKMLKIVAKRAGIKKRVGFHLFKYRWVSIKLEQGMPESYIKHQATWTNDSTMLNKYGRARSKKIVAGVLEWNGLVPEEKKQDIVLKNCPRCNITLPPGARACHQCALILDDALLIEKKETSEGIELFISGIMESPKLMKQFNQLRKKNTEATKQKK